MKIATSTFGKTLLVATTLLSLSAGALTAQSRDDYKVVKPSPTIGKLKIAGTGGTKAIACTGVSDCNEMIAFCVGTLDRDPDCTQHNGSGQPTSCSC